MSVILNGTYHSFEGNEFSVEIHKDGFSGTPTEMTLRNIVTEWDANGKVIEPVIMASQCEVTISVNSTAIEQLIIDFAGSEEGVYTIVVKKGTTLDWFGYLLIDLVEIKEGALPYDYRIRAADEIGRLKGIEYRDTNEYIYEGKQSSLGQLQNVVRELVPDVISSTHELLFTHCYYYEQNMTANTAVNPLEDSRFSHRVFRAIGRGGNIKVHSVLRVLEELCTVFGARFYLSEGKYFFESISTRGYTSGAVYHKFRKDGTSTGTLSVSNWLDWISEIGTSEQRANGSVELTVSEGAIRRYLPPLRRSILIYKHYSTRNLVEGTSGDVNNFYNATVEQVDDNGGLTKLLFRFKAGLFVNYPDPNNFTPAFIQLNFEIKVQSSATQYLRRETEYNNGLTYSLPYWSTVQGLFPVVIGAAYASAQWIHQIVQFVSATMPQDSGGEMNIRVVSYTTVDADGNQQGLIAPQWTITEPYLEAVVDGNIESQFNYSSYSSGSSDNNSAVLEMETLIGDGPTGNTFGALQVLNSQDEWVQSSQWKNLLDDTYLKPIGRIISNEMLALQDEPKLQFDYKMYGSFKAHHVLKKGLGLYMFVGGKYDYANDTWDGVFPLMVFDRTGVTDNPVNHVPDYPSDINNNVEDPFDTPFGDSPGDTGLQSISGTPNLNSAPGAGATGQDEPGVYTGQNITNPDSGEILTQTLTGNQLVSGAFPVTINGGIFPSDTEAYLHLYGGGQKFKEGQRYTLAQPNINIINPITSPQMIYTLVMWPNGTGSTYLSVTGDNLTGTNNDEYDTGLDLTGKFIWVYDNGQFLSKGTALPYGYNIPTPSNGIIVFHRPNNRPTAVYEIIVQ